MRSYYSLSEGKKIKKQHLTSITHDSNSTDKLEDDGALILTPSLQQCSVLRVYKAGYLKLHRTERSRNKDEICMCNQMVTSEKGEGNY